MARKLAVRYTSQVDKAGRIAIAAEIRAKAHLRPGDTVNITEGLSGSIVLQATPAIVREAQRFLRVSGRRLTCGRVSCSWKADRSRSVTEKCERLTLRLAVNH